MLQLPESTVAVILAAGKGQRMASDKPKMAHLLFTRPLVSYPVETVRLAGADRILVVVGHAAEEVKAALGEGFEYVLQREQLGTGHALLQTRETLRGYQGDLVVVVGDAPLLTPELIRRLIERRRQTKAAAALVTAVFESNVPPYGRILRADDGSVLRVVEERDASGDERQIREVNASVYCFDADAILPLLSEIDNSNQAGEYYLTDIVEILRRHGHDVQAVVAEDPRTILGVNTRSDMAAVFRAMRDRIIERHMAAGISILDPQTTYIDDSVKLEKDTVVYPFTLLQNKTVVQRGCVVGPFAKLNNCRIAPECHIEFASLEDAVISLPGTRISFESGTAAMHGASAEDARTEEP